MRRFLRSYEYNTSGVCCTKYRACVFVSQQQTVVKLASDASVICVMTIVVQRWRRWGQEGRFKVTKLCKTMTVNDQLTGSFVTAQCYSSITWYMCLQFVRFSDSQFVCNVCVATCLLAGWAMQRRMLRHQHYREYFKTPVTVWATSP